MINMPLFIKEVMFGTQWKNNKKSPLADRQGFTLVEIIVVIAIIVLALANILAFLGFDSRAAERGRIRLVALSLAQEAMEAVRNFRDNTTWETTGLGSLSTDTNYHPVSNSSGWNIVLGEETSNGFTRTIVFNRVSRDANDNIENSYNPVNDDPNTVKVKVIINWNDRQGPANESLTTYLTNWRK